MNNDKVAFWLCAFGGWLGLHRFYNKQYFIGVLYLVSFGALFIGWILDAKRLYKVAYIDSLSPEELEARDKKLEEKAKIRAEKRALSIEKRKEAIEKYKAERQYQQDKIKQLKKDHIPFCPKCHSTQITYVERRKRLSIGRAVAGGLIAGGAGAVLGGLTSKKYKGYVKCLNCGHTWKI